MPAICPCIKDFCNICSGLSSLHLEILARIQGICNITDPDLPFRLQSISYRWNVASLWRFRKYFHGNCYSELSSFVAQLYAFKLNTVLVAVSHHFIVEIAKWELSFYINYFLPRNFWIIEISSSFLLSCQLPSLNIYIQRCLLQSPWNLVIWYPLSPQCFIRFFHSLKPCGLVALSLYLGMKLFKKNNSKSDY